MRFSAFILVASFGSAAAANGVTLEKKKFSVKDENVVVEFKNPNKPMKTDFVGFYDKNDEDVGYLYTCGQFFYSDCNKANKAQKEGTVVFNFKRESFPAGRYTVCLKNYLEEEDRSETIGKCQQIKVVGKKKSPIKIKKEVSMFDTAVKVKFNNPVEPLSTNWVGIYDQNDEYVDPFLYTCGSEDYEVCENKPVQKNGKLEFNFNEASMETGKYVACLMDDTDPDSDAGGNFQIGICQKFKVYDPNCSKIDTKKRCKGNCTWKKDKCK